MYVCVRGIPWARVPVCRPYHASYRDRVEREGIDRGEGSETPDTEEPGGVMLYKYDN